MIVEVQAPTADPENITPVLVLSRTLQVVVSGVLVVAGSGQTRVAEPLYPISLDPQTILYSRFATGPLYPAALHV